MSGLCFILLCFFINAIFFLQGETLIKYYLTLPYLTLPVLCMLETLYNSGRGGGSCRVNMTHILCIVQSIKLMAAANI